MRNKMIQYLQIAPSLLKLRLVVILLIVFSIYPTVTYAQNEKAQALSVNLSDTLKFNEETKGLFNKLAKILKFRENRNKNEKERIYKFILELIKDQNLNVESNIDEITRLLDSINNLNLLKIDSIDKKATNNKKTIENNKKTIEALKAVVIDSFKVAMDSVVTDAIGSILIEIDSTKSSSKNIKKENIKTYPINSNNNIIMLLIVLVLISICVFLLYRKYG